MPRKRRKRKKNRNRKAVKIEIVSAKKYKPEVEYDPLSKFNQHEFKPKIVASIPTVFFTPDTYADMLIIVDRTYKEVSWLGVVEKINDDEDFLISEIIMIEQVCGDCSTEMTASALANYCQALVDAGETDKIEKIKFWGHSHVNMDTKPSWQDELQLDSFRADCDFFIRGILNKRGKIELSVYDSSKNIIIKDVPWSIHIPQIYEKKRVKKWTKEINNKVCYKLSKFAEFDLLDREDVDFSSNGHDVIWEEAVLTEEENEEIGEYNSGYTNGFAGGEEQFLNQTKDYSVVLAELMARDLLTDFEEGWLDGFNDAKDMYTSQEKADAKS